ncbi:MAG: elongator complex protein 3 [Desulfovermiculus sp.]
MSELVSMPAPVPYRPPNPIWPIFLPGMGCPTRCIYCDQKQQTGIAPQSLARIYAGLARDLDLAWQENRQPFEMAFFGGTFTSLPRFWRLKLIELVSGYKRKGLVTRIRCSTRPDCCSAPVLSELAERGLDTVELGAQSFCSHVLHTANRGYAPQIIHTACDLVRAKGLNLGIQLLPGLPGHDTRKWLHDVRQTCSLKPDFVRIYPCLVLTGTPLYLLYEQGRFKPWSLSQTVLALARGFLRFWSHGIPVIRMGLPPESDLLQAIAAGPWHPALGSLVRSKVLLALIKHLSLSLPPGPKSLLCPRSLQGDLWGHKGTNREPLLKLNLTPGRVTYHDHARIELFHL